MRRLPKPAAESLKDMGKVMGALKGKYAGQMDFGKAGGLGEAAIGLIFSAFTFMHNLSFAPCGENSHKALM